MKKSKLNIYIKVWALTLLFFNQGGTQSLPCPKTNAGKEVVNNIPEIILN